jgi:hypothetical protein
MHGAGAVQRGKLRARLLATASLGAMLTGLGQASTAANFIVANTNDTGAGSLRDAITNSNSAGGGNTISVQPGVTGQVTLGSNLPTVTASTAIDFSSGLGTSIRLFGSGGIAFNAAGVSLSAFLAHNYTGTTALQGGSLSVVGAGYNATNSPLTMAPGTTLNVNAFPSFASFASLAGGGTINLNSANGLTLTGNDQASTIFSGNMAGTGSFTIQGGSLTLTGTNTYSGPTRPQGLTSAATLAAGAANVFSPNSAMAMGFQSVLALNNFNQTVASLAGLGTVQLGSAILTMGGDNTNTLYSGGITGTGGLTKVGIGTFAIQPALGLNATYSGPTTITGGVFQAAAANSFSPNSAVAVGSNAILDLNGFNQTIGSLAGAGNVTLGAATLTVGNDNTSTVFSGGLSGIASSLTKIGSGALALLG